jgi:hypothetical protein
VASRIFETIPTIILLIICFSGCRRFRHSRPAERWLYIHLFAVLTVEGLSMLLSFFSVHNTFLFDIYVVEEFVLLSMLYRSWLSNRIHAKISIPIVALLFVVFSIYNSIHLQRHHVFNSNARAIESILLASYSVIGFYHLFQESMEEPISRNPFFWINTAILLYFSAGIFLFLLSNTLLKNMDNTFNRIVWDIHRWLAIVYYTLIGIGIWKIKLTRK